MRSGPRPGPSTGTHARRARLEASPSRDRHSALQSLSEGALHITVYDLLAHAYDRVAIQYFQDQDANPLGSQPMYAAPLFATSVLPAFEREIVAVLLADSARAMATFFGFEEMNFLVLDTEQRVYRLVVREGVFFPKFQPGSYTQPFGTGLLGLCHYERRTVLYNDVREAPQYVRTDATVRAEIAVPVVLGDAVLAIIDAGASHIDAFTPAHATFIEGFARYLAPAMADPLAFLHMWRPGLVHASDTLAPLAQSLNFLYSWHEEWRTRFARLYTEVTQRNAELRALIDLSESLNSSLRLDTILSTTVAKVAQLLACQASWILLPGGDGRLYIRALHGGTAAGLAENGIVPDGSLQFAVFARGEAVITNDLSRVPRSSFDWAFCKRNDITRYATVPLRVRERTIGVMNVGRKRTAEDLSERDIRLLATFANQIALAIENADLYERSRMLGAVEERNRLARDLHDTLVQSVVGILRVIEGSDAETATPAAQRTAITQARALAHQSLEEVRRSVWNLQPAELERQQLPEALRDYVAMWSQRTEVKTRFRLTGTPVYLGPGVEADLLHIAQEALSNVARHASAAHAAVSLRYSSADLRLVVSDDGAGFVPQVEPLDLDFAPAQTQGLGLRGMRARTHLLGGRLELKSATGQGTRIVVRMPVAGFGLASAPLPSTEAEKPPALLQTLQTLQTLDGNGQLLATHTEKLPITVLLADDHPAMREGLRLVLSKAPRLQVVGVAASGDEAVELTRALRPDVVLLDVQMPGEDGIAVLRRLRAEGLPARIVMLSAHATDANVAEALRAGASGFLQKDIEAPRLVNAITTIMEGRSVFSPAIAGRLHERAGLLANVEGGQLTAREREVLRLLAAGLTYRAIAERLYVSVATVKFHTLNLYQKLQASSRVEALNRAREWGLLG